MSSGKKPIYVLAAAILAVLLGLALARRPHRPGPAAPYACPGCNIVVILVDTLRADHLPFYGYPRDTAPFLAALAEKSLLFERAYSASSWTAPSTASIFTSLYPSQHGVITGQVISHRLKEDRGAIVANRLPAELPTMAETLRSRGFKTYGLSDNLNICEETGFSRGFDRFKMFRYLGGETLNQELVDWHAEIQGGGRYFMYLHFMEPHKPYHHSPRLHAARDENGRRMIVDAYDREIRWVDRHIQADFERFGWLQNAVVAVVSDHGEEFWERGDYGHGKTLFREVINVPLMIYLPQIQGRRVSQPVTTLDLLPTLAALAGARSDARWQGRDLLSPSAQNDARTIFSELLRRPEEERTERRSIIEGPLHLIRSTRKSGTKTSRLHDLLQDPGEEADLTPARPAEAAALEQRLQDFFSGAGRRPQEEITIAADEETAKQLRSLGYVQ